MLNRIDLFNVAELPQPWAGRSSASWGMLRRDIPHDRATLLLVDPSRPDASGLLDGRGVVRKEVEDWLSTCAKGDPLLKRAARSGIAELDQSGGDPVAGLVPKGHLLCAAILACPCSKRFWVLTLARLKKSFSPQEQIRLRCAVNQIRAKFENHHSVAAQEIRILTDSKGQIVLMDGQARSAFRCETSPAQELVDQAYVVLNQRWRKQSPDQSYDLFMRFEQEPIWIRLRRLSPAVRGMETTGYLRLRPLSAYGPPAVGVLDDPRVNWGLADIADGFRDPLGLEELGKRQNLSSFHYQRLFTAQVGMSPKHYGLRVQIINAQWLLRASAQPIAEIAPICGFSNHGHFTSTFSRILGMSPSDYRAGNEPTKAR